MLGPGEEGDVFLCIHQVAMNGRVLFGFLF